jgi:hypothetical protein
VEVAGQGKKADYAFRTGVDKFDFLVEAKKPSVSIESAPEPAYQLRRYGWSAKLPVNILTDFEHLAVYDCRQRPNPADKVAAGRILLIHYKEYETRWDEIAAIFSPEAVRRGAFEQYVAGTKGKKGTAEVDDVFLEEIERWRDLLARNIALRNPEVANERQMNYAVQMTIDRIIFLRICEDRGIEPEGQLRDIAAPTRPTPFGDDADTLPHSYPPLSPHFEVQKWGDERGVGRAGEGGGVYAELVRLFKRADQKYNSGLFHFSKEKGWDSPEDTFTPGLLIDDKVLKDILRHLYYPDSPYAFSYLSADILGQVYERFLGKVIRLTAGHQAKVEEKPEVRKAGGVYYTPTYIVDYIVHNTVGKLLEGNPTPSTSLRASPGPFAEHPAGTPDGRTPSGEGRKMTPKEAAALKVLDPACGSGSFLLGAYQYLLDWHLAWYSQNDPEKWAQGKDPAITPSVPAGHLPHFPSENGGGRVGVSWRLTTAEKKRILLNNIHGVDIDAQAVEVTKLSLLLKVLEGETGQLTLGIERALPDLSRNIQCGNSLIGPDYYEDRQLGLGLFADEEERYRVNAFDWQTAFPQVFDPHRPAATSPKSDWGSSDLGEAGRGFDAVIGNPPYRRELDYGELLDEIAQTEFGRRYKSPRMDLWYYFVHRGLEVLKTKARLSFIVNSYWTSGTGAEKLIAALRDTTHIEEVFTFGKLKVFENVSGQHMIFRLSKGQENKPTIIKVALPEKEISAEPFVTGKSKIMTFEKSKDQLFRGGKIDLMVSPNGLLAKIEVFPQLSLFGIVRQGIAENPASINKKTNEKYKNIFRTGEGVFTLRADELRALKLPNEEIVLIRPYYDLGDLGRYFIPDTPSLNLIYSTKSTCPNINDYPILREHLKRFKMIMDERRETKKGSNSWWHLHWPREERIWKSPKVISIQMAARPSFVVSRFPVYVPFSINVFVPYDTVSEDLNYFLGILNSKLLWRWYKHNAKSRGVGLEINGNVLERSPIRSINYSDPAEKAAHDKLVSLVERMLSLRKQSARTPQEQEMLRREIESTDSGIDKLVYELYGLSEEEIGIVEGK